MGVNPFYERFLDYEPAVARRSPIHVLVIDDDPMMVNLLKENFRNEGYHVSIGYDGQMAVQLARQELPDLIVLDVNMPMTNGLNAYHYIRQGTATRQIPIIFLSGEVSQDIYPVVHSGTRVAHIKKPMDLEHLNSMVRHFLDAYPVVR